MGVPLVSVVGDSFTDRSFIRPVAEFVGLENYVGSCTDGRLLGDVRPHACCGPACRCPCRSCMGLAFAMLLNQRFRGRGFLRGLFLLPWVTPVVVVALIWKWMLNDLYGVINSLLGTGSIRPGATSPGSPTSRSRCGPSSG